MTLCISIDTLAMAYLDDELADEELRELELHLRDCAACRGRVEAEREDLAQLRARLAPPPTPDVVRARLAAALDAADAQTRRSRMVGWILPGAASLAAVAALALFVLLPDQRASEPVAADVVREQMQSPKVTMPALTVGDGTGVTETLIEKVATWRSQLRGREVVHQLYQMRSPAFDVAFQVSILNARDLDLAVGERVPVSGRDLWVVQLRSRYAISYRAPDGVGYVFSSEQLSPSEMLRAIAQYELIDRVGAAMR